MTQKISTYINNAALHVLNMKRYRLFLLWFIKRHTKINLTHTNSKNKSKFLSNEKDFPNGCGVGTACCVCKALDSTLCMSRFVAPYLKIHIKNLKTREPVKL